MTARVEIGFTLSSEEQGPKELVHLARGAEEAGFSFGGPGGRNRSRDDAGRFFLGVGTGENLNEHVTGQRWPSANDDENS